MVKLRVLEVVAIALTVVSTSRPAAAQVEFATASAIVSGAGSVIKWLSEPAPNADGAVIGGLDAVLTELGAVNVGLQSALQQIQEVLIAVRDLPDEAARNGYRRNVLGAYKTFTSAKETYARRQELKRSEEEAKASLQAVARQQLAVVQQAVAEANFLAEDKYGSLTLTLCVAQAFEYEMALVAGADRAELEQIAGDFRKWLANSLDPANPRSIAYMEKQAREKLDDLTVKLGQNPYAAMIADRTGTFDIDCVDPKNASDYDNYYNRLSVFYVGYVSVPSYALIGGYKVWPQGTPGGSVEIRYLKPDGSRPYDASLNCYIYKREYNQIGGLVNGKWVGERQAEIKSRIDNWVDLAPKANQVKMDLAAISAAVAACQKAMEQTDEVWKVLNEPRRIPI